ncbi:hypothetical protein TeGR_g11693 [Tetraparma gracilis]|uniref:Uncharacterized protein n=1 Tax=Tetraparma gracilis TaxID=2962635 RepID=A0ABQ6M5U1_9STRA|nr:hypothetical protein TeGR_g11693 [Tetraparma gracilis]
MPRHSDSHSSLSSGMSSATSSMLQDFLVAWRVRTVEEIKGRAAAERRMRDMVRRNNAAQRVEARNLMVAVTFKLWKENVREIQAEKKAEAARRRLANARLATAKMKPTKDMLKRRASVIDARGGRSTRGGGTRGRGGKDMDMFEAARQAVLEEERREREGDRREEEERWEKERARREGVFRALKGRQMKALDVARGAMVRMRTASEGDEARMTPRINTANGTLTDRAEWGSWHAGSRGGGGGGIFDLFYQTPKGGGAAAFFENPVPPEEGRSVSAPGGARGVTEGVTEGEVLKSQRDFLRRVYQRSREGRGLTGDGGGGKGGGSRMGRGRAASAPSPGPEGGDGGGEEGWVGGRLSPIPQAH